jgi:hypothetical protein
MQSHRPSREELDALEAEISERFPAWRFVGLGQGYGDVYLAAERVGTHPDRQSASDARGLLQAIEARERQLESIPTGARVHIHEGLDSN